jgi:hypothetical protein
MYEEQAQLLKVLFYLVWVFVMKNYLIVEHLYS